MVTGSRIAGIIRGQEMLTEKEGRRTQARILKLKKLDSHLQILRVDNSIPKTISNLEIEAAPVGHCK